MSNKEIAINWWLSLNNNVKQSFINQYNSYFANDGAVCELYSLNFLPDFFIEKIAQKEGIIAI